MHRHLSHIQEKKEQRTQQQKQQRNLILTRGLHVHLHTMYTNVTTESLPQQLTRGLGA
jgi:hypothetical protein